MSSWGHMIPTRRRPRRRPSGEEEMPLPWTGCTWSPPVRWRQGACQAGGREDLTTWGRPRVQAGVGVLGSSQASYPCQIPHCVPLISCPQALSQMPRVSRSLAPSTPWDAGDGVCSSRTQLKGKGQHPRSARLSEVTAEIPRQQRGPAESHYTRAVGIGGHSVGLFREPQETCHRGYVRPSPQVQETVSRRGRQWGRPLEIGRKRLLSRRGRLISRPEDGRVGSGPKPSTCGHVKATSVECPSGGEWGSLGSPPRKAGATVRGSTLNSGGGSQLFDQRNKAPLGG